MIQGSRFNKKGKKTMKKLYSNKPVIVSLLLFNFLRWEDLVPFSLPSCWQKPAHVKSYILEGF